MLLIFLLFLIIAISLPYFSLSSINSGVFWKRISVISLVIISLLYLETITLDFNNTITLYNGLFAHTLQNSIFIGIIIFSGLILNTITGDLSINNSTNTLNVINNKIDLSLDTRNRERLVFVFSLIIGGIILSGSSDMLTVLLGLELQSYSAYILAASYRNYEPSEAAGLKYFLLGALSSALIFMGLGLLYVYTGNTMIDLSFLILSSINYSNSIFTIDTMVPYLGGILILIGFFWKIAAAPLQAWSIDVYDAVPTKTTAILSIIPKIGLISFIVKITYDLTSLVNFAVLLEKGFNLNVLDINYIIYVIIALSLIVGSIYGIFQPRIKRLLAYSSVLNIGFILMGTLLINYGQHDNFNPLFYLIQYIITTSTIWLCLTSIEKLSYIEVTLISQLQGIANENQYGRFNTLSILNFKTTFIAISLTVLILSTAGIPPMVGFFAKYEVILLSLKTEYFTLAILAILASLISTYYYLNIVKNIWFKTALVNLSVQPTNLVLSGATRSADQPFESYQKDKLSEITGISSQISLLTISIALFAIQYSVIYTFLTLSGHF